MSKKYTVSVTEEDIKNGCRYSPTECPLALALKRSATDSIYVSVGVHSGSFEYRSGFGNTFEREWLFGVLPKNAQQFINDFDNKKTTEPFEFEIEVGE